MENLFHLNDVDKVLIYQLRTSQRFHQDVNIYKNMATAKISSEKENEKD